MKNIKKLKKGRIIASALILVLVALIVSIVKIASIDKYAGLVKVQDASLSKISTKLSANISDLSEDNAIYTRGYDEVDYTIKYKLSEVVGDRDVIITASIPENDRYSSFKEVTGTNVSSHLSADRRRITITISNLPSNEEITSKVTLIISNAPRGYQVTPTIKIKESTSEDETNIAVTPVTVNTNSLQGSVVDDQGNKVKGVLVALKKNNELIKETYTNNDGFYTLSDIEADTYSIEIDEEIYDTLEVNNLYINEGNVLNLIVKRVYPYKIETNKYITKVELNNLGSSKDYKYDDTILAQIPVKKVDNLHGKIYYKIVVQNTGEKSGIITAVKDELPEGLSFDEELNSGYELKNGIIYNRNLEGKELAAGEMITDTLVLTIENTDVAKTYINQVSAKGEIYEHVVYLLNGRQYKTLDVLQGEYIDDLHVNNPNFDGWYTDEKLTNRFNPTLPVNKDLILYGVTKNKHTVIFNDKHPETLEVTKYDEQKVNNGEPVVKPTPDPSKTGYTFCGWDTEENTPWDFNNVVTSDLILTSCYNINEYNIEFYDKSASNGAEYSKILTLTKVYKSTLSNSEAPDLSNVWEGHNFLQWTTDQEGNNPYDFNALITGPVKLYAQYTLQDRLFIFNDENDITQKTVDYGSTVTEIAPNGKEGHDFLFWSLTSPSSTETKTAFDFNTPIYQTTTVYAIYQIRNYPVVFNDVDPWTGITAPHDTQNIDHGEKATRPVDPDEKEGHTFCGWLDGTTAYDFDTIITGPKTLTACYEKNKVTVEFRHNGNLWESKTIDYGDKVTPPATTPSEEHKIFLFWSEDGTTGFNYDTAIKSNKVLNSVFEEITPPTITHTPLYWTNDKVLVTISHASTAEGLSFKYKVDDGTYQDYTEPFELETNSTIVAKTVYGDSESTITSHDVTNIDKLNPAIDSTSVSGVTKNSVTIVGTMSDNQSGVKTINVIQDNVTVGTVSGTAINADLRDYTKEKEYTYVVYNLTPNTEYTFTVQVVDGAGNINSTEVTATTEREEPICRIISVDGVDLPEQDYVEFTLLEYAIKDPLCTSKCTIQMLKGTTESNSILNTQDITLDLNGKTVSGVLPGYTIDNQGEFTLVDDANNGALKNSLDGGIAVKNNAGAKFTMGRGSSEEPVGTETRMVSITTPLVFGEAYGIYSENGAEFSFFDGKVKGTNAIQGEVTETEYLYNASSDTPNEYEEVTLAILDDPEARLNKSKYYSNIANAVRDAKIGTSEIESTPTTFLSGFTHTSQKVAGYDTEAGYTFIYDENTDTLTSSNDIYGSVAFTETVIDLTNYETDKLFEIIYHIDNIQKNTRGNIENYKTYVNIGVYPLDDNFNSTSTLNSKISKEGYTLYELQKGNKYKVKISYTQPVKLVTGTITSNQGGYDVTTPDEYSDAKMVITSAALRDAETEYFENTIQQNAFNLYGFYYDAETDTYRSNNQYGDEYSKGEAYSCLEVNIEEEGTYDLYIDASIEGLNYHQGIITMGGPELPSNFSTYNSSNIWSINLYSSGNTGYQDNAALFGYDSKYQKVGPTNARIRLGKGHYYIWFAMKKQAYGNNYPEYTEEAFKANGIADQFIINSLKLVKIDPSTAEEIDIPTEMKGNAFETDHLFSYDGGTYGLTHNNADEYHDSYVKIDLTDSEKDKILEINPGYSYYNFGAVYITNNNRGLTQQEIIDNRYDMLMFKNDWNNSSYPSIQGSSYYNAGLIKGYLLEKGNVYYVHFNTFLGYSWTRIDYQNEGYDCYNEYGECGLRLKGLSLRDVEETLINFGKYKINTGTVDVDGLAEESTTINLQNTDSLTLKQNTASTYEYNSETHRYELQQPIGPGGVGDFLTAIDLTGETEPQLYYYGSSDSLPNYYHFYTVDEPLQLHHYSGSSITCSPNCNYNYVNSNSYFSLDPGHVYYFRRTIGTYSGDRITSDSFTLEHIGSAKEKNYTTASNVVTFNEKVDEIQILKNIQLASSMVINPNKEAVLDLNGYKITSSLNTPIIDNYGKLTIIDSDYENQTSENKTHNGILESSYGTIILNEENATLTMKDFQMNNSTSRYGIQNKGYLVFADNSDGKIYVKTQNATGIYNEKSGRIHSPMSSLQIVLSYSGSKKYNSYYAYLDSRRINTGMKNEGYLNVTDLTISGNNGTGLENSGMAIIRNSNITVGYEPADISNGYKYKYVSSGYYSSTTWYDIEDYSILGTGGSLSLENTVVGYRAKSSNIDNTLYVMSGTSFGILYNEGQLYVNANGKFANTLYHNSSYGYAKATISSATDDGYVSADKIYNTGRGSMQMYNFNNMDSSFMFENSENALLEAYNSNMYDINNIEDASMRIVNSNLKHIKNKGFRVILNSTTVDNEDTSFNEAIYNTSLLDLEYNVNVLDHNKYAIYMEPYKTESDSYDNSATYRQAILSIGTDLEHQDSVVIQGAQYGVTGSCYVNENIDLSQSYNQNRLRYQEINEDVTYCTYDENNRTPQCKISFDGEEGKITQDNYDQTFCKVNFYSGQIKGQNEREKLLDIPIFKTLEGYNAHVGYEGIKVSSNTDISNYESGLENKNYVAQIGNTKYYTLKEAFDSITTNDPVTVDVINDNINIESIVIPEGRNITVNYTNGTKTYSYANKGFINNGNLTITGNGLVNVASKYVYDNNGTMNVTNGNYDNIAKLFPRESALVNNKGDITVTNGTYNNIDIYNWKNATINNGTFNGTMFYGKGEESNTIVKAKEINEGNVPTHHEYYDDNHNVVKNELRHIFHLVAGANARLEDYNTENVTNYTHTRPLAYTKASTLELKNVNIGAPTDENYNPVYVDATERSNVIINDGNYEQLYLIDNGSDLTINSGTLKNYSKETKNNNLLLITGKRPNVYIRGGELISTGNAIGLTQYDYDYDIDRDYSYSLILGTKGDKDENNEVICSKTSPVIAGNSMGITSYGSVSGYGFFGFYDGIVKGKSNSVDVEINEIEPDYEVISDSTIEYPFVKYLDQQDLVKNTTTGVIYKSFQKAFNEATNGDILETLREFTNTTQSEQIIIPETSNFTLKIKHRIVINNTRFIENNGNATFVGVITPSQSGPDQNTDYGEVISNAAGTTFTNNGTLTIRDLSITNIKEYGIMFNNTENSTLNLLGANITTLQNRIVRNDGILNIDKTGTDECYNTTRIHMNYVKDTQCDNYNVAITNIGTANINYMTLKSDNYCTMLENTGNMKIDHSTIDQSSYIEGDYIDIDTDYVHENSNNIISTFGNLEIDNSTLIIVPKTAIVERGGLNYWNDYGPKYVELNYIGIGNSFDGYSYSPSNNNINITIKNTVADTSIYGFIHTSKLNPTINISNSNIHSHSFGIMYDGKATMTLNNNVFNTYDASIEFNRYTESYTSSGSWNIYPLAFMTPNDDSKDSVITINGGSYTSNMNLGNFEYKYYTPNSGIQYSTMCVNGNMDTVELDTSQRSYDTGTQPTYYYNSLPYLEAHTNVITSAGTLNINDATITGDNSGDRYYDNSNYFIYCSPVGTNPNDSSNTTCNVTQATDNEMAAITAFGTTNINNTIINTSNGYDVTAIKLRGSDAVLNLGTKDGTYDDETPSVKSLDTEPIVGGSLHFYDGIIETTNSSIIQPIKNITDIEDGYSVKKDNKSIYLIQNDVIENVTKDIGYVSIQAAINAASDGDTLKFLESTVPKQNEEITIDGKEITIDLNGKHEAYQYNVINSSKLTVEANADGDNYIKNFTVDSSSELILRGGNGYVYTYGKTTMTGSSKYAVMGYENGIVNVDNLTASNYVDAGVYMHGNSTLNITDSRISTVTLDDTVTMNLSYSSESALLINQLTNRTSVPLNISSGVFNTIINNGTLNITGGTIKNVTNNAGSLTINGATIGKELINNNNAQATLTNATIIESQIQNAGILTVNSGTYGSIYNKNNGQLTINDGTLGYIYNNQTSIYYPNNIVNIYGGTFQRIPRSNGSWGAGVTNAQGTVNIGVEDGNVSTTVPSFEDTSSGVISNSGTLRFYDGIIIGPKNYSLITGSISSVEDGYNLFETSYDADRTAIYLSPITHNDSKVASVNGIYYSSLQEAINKSVINCTSGSTCPVVSITHNVELDADLTIADGYAVDIQSNGYSFSTNGHTVPTTITLDGQPIVDETLGGNIVNSLRGALGFDSVTKDVLIYEMHDGSSLSTENHYKLYKYSNGEYELITMNKGDEVARYTPGKGLTNMKPIKGRLYLIDIEPGDYKVTDDNGSEVTFTISDEGSLSGHVKEYIDNPDSKVESTGEAKLLISIQTGIKRVNYMLVAISLIAILSVMFILQKRKNKKELAN